MSGVTRRPVVIRNARRSDAGAIGATHAEAWRVAYPDIFGPDDLDRLVEHRRTERWPATFDDPTFDDPTFATTTLFVAVRAGDQTGRPRRRTPRHRDRVHPRPLPGSGLTVMV